MKRCCWKHLVLQRRRHITIYMMYNQINGKPKEIFLLLSMLEMFLFFLFWLPPSFSQSLSLSLSTWHMNTWQFLCPDAIDGINGSNIIAWVDENFKTIVLLCVDIVACVFIMTYEAVDLANTEMALWKPNANQFISINLQIELLCDLYVIYIYRYNRSSVIKIIFRFRTMTHTYIYI